MALIYSPEQFSKKAYWNKRTWITCDTLDASRQKYYKMCYFWIFWFFNIKYKSMLTFGKLKIRYFPKFVDKWEVPLYVKLSVKTIGVCGIFSLAGYKKQSAQKTGYKK